MRTAVIILIMSAIVLLGGCKKEAVAGTAKADSNAAVTEQTKCPVMDGAINKDIFTVYKGKKVYFCCPGCKPEFEKNPEKYIDKLPQFKNK